MRMLPRLGTVVEAFRVRQKASMTHASSPLLHADRLSVARGDALLIEELSFALQPGEALHVLGENGAGKSTLLLALAGLIPLASGTVAVDRDALAFLGHDNGLLPDLSVAENMALYAGSGVVADPQTCAAMGISKLSAKPARTLSFGQARRVALALTCLPEKALWLLDEPFAGLDTQTAQTLERVLAQHTARRGAVVYTSHERGLAQARNLTLAPRGDEDV